MSKKPRVAIFHCGFIYSGGGERIILEEAKGLKQRGYEVEVFAPTLDKKLCYPEDVKNLNVKTFFPQFPAFIPFRNAISMILTSIFAPFFAPRFRKVDLFLGANQPGAWIAFCISKILNKPYLVYMNQPNRLLYPRKIDMEVKWHNIKEYDFIDKLLKKMRFFVSWADRISFTSGSAILENGDYIGKVIRDIYKKPTVSCPAGAYPQPLQKLRLHSNNNGNLQIKNLKGEEFKINRPYILITNRHEPQKKFEWGIKALKLVAKDQQDVILMIPGPSTPYTSGLLELSRNLKIEKKVLFLGQISEETLQRLYQEAAVYVYTAPEEDFGMGVLEAMAWGVPVVAWNHAGPTGTVIDGKTGYLAKPYSIPDFAQKIYSILLSRQSRNEMGKAAWEHAKNNFSWEKHIDILEDELKKCS